MSAELCPGCGAGRRPGPCPVCGQGQESRVLRHAAAASLASLLVLFLHQGSLLRPLLGPGAGDLAALGEVNQLIRERWVEAPDPRALRDGALSGMVSTLDPFSAYVSPEELAAFEEETTGQYGGLGMWVTVEGGQLAVIAPIEDTPAWKGGILPGDVVVAIDGQPPPEFKNASEAVAMLKGAPGSRIVLTVLHRGVEEPEEIALVRAIIQVHTVKGARILAKGVGYVRVTSFNAGTVQEFDQACQKLVEQGVMALIIDLRENPGGYLQDAVEIADRLLPKGAGIVTTRIREGQIEQQLDSTEPPSYAMPLAVLVDGGSASASEILAGALQDGGVATVVGTRSYGKGSVQSLIPIQRGQARLKLTTQYFYTPKGRRIHRGTRGPEEPEWGVTPTIQVTVDPRLRRQLQAEESERELARLSAKANGQAAVPEERLHLDDPQVRAAFEHLRAVLDGREKLGVERVIASAEVAPVDSAAPAQDTPPPAHDEGQRDEGQSDEGR